MEVTIDHIECVKIINLQDNLIEHLKKQIEVQDALIKEYQLVIEDINKNKEFILKSYDEQMTLLAEGLKKYCNKSF